MPMRASYFPAAAPLAANAGGRGCNSTSAMLTTGWIISPVMACSPCRLEPGASVAPGGLAFFEERGDAFLALGRHPQLRNEGGVGCIDGGRIVVRRDARHQRLRGRRGHRAG